MGKSELENEREETAHREKEAEKWKGRVDHQAHVLSKLVKKARHLGHPVDELLGIKPAPEKVDQKRRKKPDPQYENFEDAARLIRHAIDVDKGVESRAASQIGKALWHA